MPALRQQKRRAALGLLRPRIQEECVKPASRISRMRFDKFSFGSLQIDGSSYEHDVLLAEFLGRLPLAFGDLPAIDQFGHTPLSVEENIPWKCRQLVIGNGAYGRLPVMQEVRREAERRKIKLLVLPTIEAIELLNQNPKDTNAILHVTAKRLHQILAIDPHSDET